MNLATNAVQDLRQQASPAELDILGLLLADSCVNSALRDADKPMLQRVLGVSVMSFEDMIKERHGVVFRNYTGHFEIVQNKETILKTEDDVLGSVGTSIVQRAMQRAGTTLMSYYLSGKRSRESLQDIATAIDREGVSNALEQLEAAYAPTKKAVQKLKGIATRAANLPLPDECKGDDDRAVWYEYLSALTVLFTQLRTNPAPIYVQDRRVTGQVTTVALAIKSRLDLTALVFRSKASQFSKTELGMFEMLDLGEPDYVVVQHPVDDVPTDHLVKAARDVFSYIGSQYQEPMGIPDWTEPTIRPPTVPTAPARIMSPTHRPCDKEPESIIRDYFGVDMNKFKDVRVQLVGGGISERAKDVWASLSKAKQIQLLKPIDGRVGFREAVALSAAQLDVDPDEAFAEVVASKLVMAKSAFKINKADMTVERV